MILFVDDTEINAGIKNLSTNRGIHEFWLDAGKVEVVADSTFWVGIDLQFCSNQDKKDFLDNHNASIGKRRKIEVLDESEKWLFRYWCVMKMEDSTVPESGRFGNLMLEVVLLPKVELPSIVPAQHVG